MNSISKFILRTLEVAIVIAAIACLGIRSIKSDDYEAYLKQGGTRSFWSWVTTDEGTVQSEIAEAEAQKKAAWLARKKQAALAAVKAEAERIAALEKRAAELRAKQKRINREAKKRAAAQKRKHDQAAKHRGGAVKTGGKSNYIAGNGRTPYRVNGIQGIEFGTSDNAPGEKVKPLLSVTYDENGNMVFKQLKWRENKQLTDSVYGFDKAMLEHSIDSEQLSSVIFNKSFPFTEQGLKDAMAFYDKMTGEASADLGFEPITKDNTGDLASSSICRFSNKGGDTTISGGINAWSQDHLTVTLRVSDNAYSAETRSQSKAAYESGLADAVDARVEVWGKDYTENKVRVNEYLSSK